jgi:hypothetical protein
VKHKNACLKRAGASLFIAIALIAAGAAHGSSGAEAPAGAARSTVEVRISPPDAGSGRGGVDRRDAAIGAAIVGGVLLLGLRGHLAVGAVIGVAAWLLAAGARLVTGKPRAGRGWSDWPGPDVDRAQQREGRRRLLLPSPGGPGIQSSTD